MYAEAKPNWIKFLSYFLLVAVGVYIALRAVYVPLYSDEAMTFFIYVKTGGFDPFLSLQSANNHVLNSALMRLSFLLFGDSPLALRLPNILAYILFAVYALKIQHRFEQPLIGLTWLVVMIGSHYFISFFHLARGYGMSMAFLMAALYHLLNLGRGANIKGFLLFCLFLSMAIWSNLSLLVPAIAMYFVVCSGLGMQLWKNRNLKSILLFSSVLLICGLVPFYGALKIALSLKDAGALYHGTSQGFQEVLIKLFMLELAPEFTYTAHYFFWPFFSAYGLALLWITAFKKWTKMALLAQVVFWTMLAGTVLMHEVLQINYPLDRAALHFFPLFVLAFFTAADAVPLRFSLPVSIVPATLLVIQQVSFMNLNRTAHWDNEHVPLEVLDYLHDWKDSTGKLPIVSVHGLPGRGLVYEVYRDKREPIYPIFDGFPAASADFILTYQWEQNYPEGYAARLNFPGVKMRLLERVEPVNWKLAKQIAIEKVVLEHGGGNLAEFALDGREFDALYISFSGELECPAVPYVGWLALDILDTSHQQLSRYYIDFAHTKIPTEKTTIRHKLVKDKLPPMPIITALRWMNVGGQEYSLEQVNIDCFVKSHNN